MTEGHYSIFAESVSVRDERGPHTSNTRRKRGDGSHRTIGEIREIVGTHLDRSRCDGTVNLVGLLHVPLEVDVQELKHKIQLCIGMYDIQESVKYSVLEGSNDDGRGA